MIDAKTKLRHLSYTCPHATTWKIAISVVWYFYVTVVTLLMTLLMNKFTSIIVSQIFGHLVNYRLIVEIWMKSS